MTILNDAMQNSKVGKIMAASCMHRAQNPQLAKTRLSFKRAEVGNLQIVTYLPKKELGKNSLAGI